MHMHLPNRPLFILSGSSISSIYIFMNDPSKESPLKEKLTQLQKIATSVIQKQAKEDALWKELYPICKRIKQQDKWFALVLATLTKECITIYQSIIYSQSNPKHISNRYLFVNLAGVASGTLNGTSMKMQSVATCRHSHFSQRTVSIVSVRQAIFAAWSLCTPSTEPHRMPLLDNPLAACSCPIYFIIHSDGRTVHMQGR
jgi:hypothetical protein